MEKLPSVLFQVNVEQNNITVAFLLLTA